MQTQLKCPQCQAPVIAEIFQLIDADRTPQLKQMLIQGSLNVAQCQNCGWAGAVGTPLLYHDAAHELFMVYLPMEMNISVPEREKLVGSMVRQVVDSMPPDKRKAYLLNPQQIITWKSFMEKVLETEGITPEMIEHQRQQVDLLQKLATVDKDVAAVLLEDNPRLIDAQFFALIQQMIESLSRSQQGQAQLVKLTNVRAQLMRETAVGRQLQKENMALHAFNMDVKKVGQLRPEVLLKHVVANRNDASVVEAVASAGQPALTYEFFSMLSAEIDSASDPVDKKLLGDIRTSLLAMYDAIQAASSKIVAEATETIEILLNAENQELAIAEYIGRIDDNFMAILSAQMRQAEQQGDEARADALFALQETIVNMAEQAVPREMRLINDLMTTQTEEEARQLLDQHADLVTPEFTQAVDSLAAELEAEGQMSLKGKLDQIRGLIAARTLT